MTKQKGTYRVEVEKELIHVTVVGSLDVEALDACYEETNKIMTAKHGPKDILVDISNAGLPDRSAAKRALEYFREGPNYRRVAIYGGAKPSVMLVTTNIMHAARSNETLKAFREERRAREWLNELHHPVKAKLKKRLPGGKKE